jgi:hypothetical protein
LIVRLLIVAGALLLGRPALGQSTGAIQWSQDVEQSIARAQQTRRPIMFWVLGRSDSRDKRVERDQQQAFRDPRVLELSSRFIPAKLSRSRYRDQLEKWNLSPKTNLEIVFATPDGDKIDTLASAGVRQADVLARKMTLVFRYYRQVLFDQELKPKLEDESTSDEELEQALKLITELVILPADQSVIALLERPSLSGGTRRAVYDALATLSTSASVEALLAHAREDEHAAGALRNCTPDAAEQMLPALEGDDAALQLAVYHAVTRICKLRDVKPDRFWNGRYQVVKQKEIDRVRREATAVAQRWRQRYAEYR